LVLHPRTSFELWKQEVRGRAEPWSRAEEEAASRLRVNLVDEAITRANRELRLVNERLREKNAEMDSFAYVVSHDLKEPLRGLQFHSKTLLRDHGDKLDEKGIHKLERIKGLSERMTGLMDALLEYSRMGRTELRVQECDLNEVVENVLELLRTSVERKGFEVRIPEPLPCVSCDPVKIGEVYNNLISNALKYNDKAEKWIELGADESNGEAWLYVRDNGIGIEQEHHGDIFGMFKRLHGREEWGGGTGSGLAMVAKILERHDSSIKVESEPGEETTFYFNLPLCGG
jgi:light-regulated signal transduction histidine kinase (bacteriophytochrome)